MLAVVATIAAAAATGVAVERRTGALAVALARRLLEVMLFVLAPFASFVNVAHLEVTGDIRGGVGAGWLALVLAGAAGWLPGRRVLRLPPPSAAALATAGLVSNTAISAAAVRRCRWPPPWASPSARLCETGAPCGPSCSG